MPQVSICIPTFNGALFLAESIESALAQSFHDLDILVVDDSSTDDTLAIARSYALRDKRVRISQNPRTLGLVGNWNRSVSLAKGEWIKFLHQDDRLAVNCVAQMVTAATPAVGLVATRRQLTFMPDISDDVKISYNQYLADHELTRLFSSPRYVPAHMFIQVLLQGAQGNFLGEPTAIMVRRAAFETYGYFNPDVASLCDWEYWMRVAVNTGLTYVDEPLAYFRVHSTSESARLRSTKRFRLRLDPVMILYEMTYSPHYRPLRVAASRMIPPVNLRERLSDALVSAHSEAVADTDPTEAVAQWWQIVRRRPRLLALSPRHMLRLLRDRRPS